MKIKQSLAVAGIMATVGAAGIGGASIVSAQSDPGGTSSTGLVEKIASKFNLSQTDVQAVFDQDKTDRQAEITKKLDSELSTLVTDGKITSEQKQKILDKRAELENQRGADRSMMESKTDAERKTAMDTKQTELKKWASDNGIAEEYAKYVMGGGHGGRHGGPRPDMPADKATN